MISGRFVKKIRQGLDCDQKAFGKLLRVNQQTVSSWEARKEAAIPRPGERKIRRYLIETYGVKISAESTDESEEMILGAMTAAGAAVGALFGGIPGAVLGGTLGAAGGLVDKKGAKQVLETKCPHCSKIVTIAGIDLEAEYVCGYCDEVFKFKKGLGRAVRVASKPNPK